MGKSFLKKDAVRSLRRRQNLLRIELFVRFKNSGLLCGFLKARRMPPRPCFIETGVAAVSGGFPEGAAGGRALRRDMAHFLGASPRRINHHGAGTSWRIFHRKRFFAMK
ncbi:MAG: hypothetical protein LBP86_12125 [Azoarcus sp.]|jgi:hypothetical protein|nr:hypothetical protein [Azoarcus sp.]